MNIEFIKWLCEKAEGFEVDMKWESALRPGEKKLLVKCPDADLWRVDWGDEEQHVYYPLLLQRAIEGVNEGNEYSIDMNRQLITVYEVHPYPTYRNQVDFDDCKTIDQAKEASLKWVWENEK